MPLVIGLRGLAGAGKTTVQTALGMTGMFDLYSLAAPMRQGFLRMGVTKQDTPDLYREWLQKVGETMRQRDPDHWVKMAQPHITQTMMRGRHCCLDDVRFPNEAALCDLIFFLRPDGFEPADLGARAEHVSEAWNRSWMAKDPTGQSFPTPTLEIPNRVGQVQATADLILDHVIQYRGVPLNRALTMAGGVRT